MANQELFFRKLGQGPPLVILHGLFGSSDNWLTMGRALSDFFEVYLVDQRNHGQSFHTPPHALEDLANDLAGFISSHHILRPVVMGHSMGGKAAMHYSLRYPHVPAGLIVADISPRAYPVHHDYILNGFRAIDLNSLASRKEADEILAKYVSGVEERQFLLKSLTRGANGFEWRLNIAALAENIDKIVAEVAGPPAELPTLFVRGEKSTYINQEDTELISRQFPNSRVVTIKNAGHWVHAEQPEAFLEAVKSFLL